MKCEYCGKKLGLFNRVTIKQTEHICKDHLAEWGFTSSDLKTDRYKWKSWRFLQKGKKECDAIFDREEYVRTHTREMIIKLGYVEDENIEKFITKTAKKDLDTDDLYGGWTIKEMKDYDDEGPHYIFEGIDFDCEIKEWKVIFGGKPIADVTPPEIPYQYETYLNIDGGKYRKLIFDGEKMVGHSDEKLYWLQLKIVYVEEP